MKNMFKTIAQRGGSLLLVALVAGLAFAAESNPSIGKGDVKDLIAKASTPAEHHQLAAYFTDKADKMEAEAVEHEELAKAYTKNNGMHEMKHPMSGNTAEHCKFFVQAARKAAAEDRALASAHEDMAKRAQK